MSHEEQNSSRRGNVSTPQPYSSLQLFFSPFLLLTFDFTYFPLICQVPRAYRDAATALTSILKKSKSVVVPIIMQTPDAPTPSALYFPCLFLIFSFICTNSHPYNIVDWEIKKPTQGGDNETCDEPACRSSSSHWLCTSQHVGIIFF